MLFLRFFKIMFFLFALVKEAASSNVSLLLGIKTGMTRDQVEHRAGFRAE